MMGGMRAGLPSLLLVLAFGTPAPVAAQEEAAPVVPDHGAGFTTIDEDDVLDHLKHVAAPELEGRDSPSAGLFRVADYIEARLKAAGLEPVGSSYRNPFSRESTVPLPAGCSLEVAREEGEKPTAYALGQDFVPLGVCRGEGQGSLVFAGFGITGTKERYDDLRGLKIAGKVVMALEGEPRHKKVFDGLELTREADLFRKAANLMDKGAVGVLFVRRRPPEPTETENGELEPPKLGYRHTWARWNDGKGYKREKRDLEIPVLEISQATASALLGEDVAKIAARMDKRAKPEQRELDEVTVYLRASFRDDVVQMDNVVGLLPGSDPSVASEVLVLGAHYDHIGVDPWGRIGYGADDNGSGTTALLELVDAMAAAAPRRSVLFAFFAAEEDGLIGSRRFCDDPPIDRKRMVAMLNMDMLGVGERDEIVVIGTHAHPGFLGTLKRAKKLKSTKVKSVETDKGRDLWERSDHFSFHEIGLPVLFFTEGYPETNNKDYHTYRDTIESIDVEKITRSARFIFNTAWLCANEETAYPAP